jgi:hypothetical protein
MATPPNKELIAWNRKLEIGIKKILQSNEKLLTKVKVKRLARKIEN